MQTVYRYSIGRQFVSQTAPAILAPSLSRMTLADALQILSKCDRHRRLATWTIARSLSVESAARASLDRYPEALLAVLTKDDLDHLQSFEEIRGAYCGLADVFAAAFVACAPDDNCLESVDGVVGEIVCEYDNGQGCAADVSITQRFEDLSTDTPERPLVAACIIRAFLHDELGLSATNPGPCEDELRRFVNEVDMPLSAFTRRFADALAFQRGLEPSARVLPAVSIATQDASSLLTRVTATALVIGTSREQLWTGMNPENWAIGSDLFKLSRWVEGPLDLTPRPTRSATGPWYLEERVNLLWGDDAEVGGWCRNVLRFDRLDEGQAGIEIRFDLARSIESRLLWDVRPGGLLVDSGYLVAREVAAFQDVWRVTLRKTLRWSDRDPYRSGDGNDRGEELNYLAPATVSWWEESQMYSYEPEAAAA